jgi:hypothetical protein
MKFVTLFENNKAFIMHIETMFIVVCVCYQPIWNI